MREISGENMWIEIGNMTSNMKNPYPICCRYQGAHRKDIANRNCILAPLDPLTRASGRLLAFGGYCTHYPNNS